MWKIEEEKKMDMRNDFSAPASIDRVIACLFVNLAQA